MHEPDSDAKVGAPGLVLFRVVGLHRVSLLNGGGWEGLFIFGDVLPKAVQR